MITHKFALRVGETLVHFEAVISSYSDFNHYYLLEEVGKQRFVAMKGLDDESLYNTKLAVEREAQAYLRREMSFEVVK